MILYFADRKMNIIGQASTSLPNGLTIYDDWKKEDIESGVASFECRIPYDKKTRKDVEGMAAVGNYILRSNGEENEFYTIIESESNTRDQEVYVYAEDAGLDLLNEIVGDFEATSAQPISWYIGQFAADSGFEIGVNEAANLTRKLSWEGEETVTSRLASLATQFDGCEISYSFAVDGLLVTNKYINIHKKRGKDAGIQLRLNKEVDRIVTKQSIANLATAFVCKGGMSDQEHAILEKTSNSVLYKVELQAQSRTANSVSFKTTVSAALTSESAELGDKYGLKASIYINGSWHSATIKATDKDNKQKWSGTTSHSTDFTFTVSGIASGMVTFSDVRFKVERTDSAGGTAGVLSSTACIPYTIPNYIPGGENGEDLENRNITLEGYKYDDGDFYIDGKYLKSRNAVQIWSRYVWNKEPNKLANGEGHIVKTFEYDAFSQSELCTQSIAELKKAREIEVNYEVDINRLPQGVKIGDRVNIIDDEIGLYVSARILMFETSVVDQEQKATIGEYLIKDDGIAQKVYELAEKFAEYAYSTSQAKKIATDAQKAAESANTQAQTALQSANEAGEKAEEAKTASDTALQSATEAEGKANEAKQAVEGVQESVAGMEQSIADAEAAAEQARQAAETAQTKAEEAHTASVNAGEQAQAAKQTADQATEKANEAIEKGNAAESKAEQAKQQAVDASTTALAAKQDAQKAQEEIDALGDNLTTIVETMEADYARKTDLTESEAHLQAQITKNAAELKTTVSKVQVIDETANDASIKAQAAYYNAQQAQEEADAAMQAASEAWDYAGQAQTAYLSAQGEADAAREAADTAQAVLDEANAELADAQADLETIQGRADATEAEIAEAQARVDGAQIAATQAKEEADIAIMIATMAQQAADSAKEEANTAQSAANSATSQAYIAARVAEEVSGSAAAEAQKTADEAKQSAQDAQSAADQAKANATAAQSTADQAKADAQTAQTKADEAKAKADTAQSDLNTAKQNLENVTSRVDATEEEVAQAKADVEAAQQLADQAKADAQSAQTKADQAKADAQTAQTAATNAQNKANEAQQAANDAKSAADKAQADVDKLAIRVTTAETSITQTNEQIALMATKKESVLIPKVTGQYTNTVVVENALSDSVEVNLYGKSWQNTVGGNQLFNPSALSLRGATLENDIITVTSDTTDFYLCGSYGGGTSLFDLVKGTYAMSTNNSNIRVSMYCLIDGNINALDNRISVSTTLLADTSIHGIRIRSIDGTSLKGKSFGIMLNKGTTALPWEEYVGGTPSPNPSYPQDINCHGEDGSVEVVMQPQSANLIDQTKAKVLNLSTSAWNGSVMLISYALSVYGRLIEIPFVAKNGETYYVSYNVIKNTTVSNVSFYFPETQHYTPIRAVEGKASGVVTMKGDVTKCVIYIDDKYFDSNAEVRINDFIISSAEVPYEPYREPTTVAFQTPNGFNGIQVLENGNYIDKDGQQWLCDEVDFKNRKYIQRIKRTVIDGSSGADMSQYAGNKTNNTNYRVYSPGFKKSGVVIATHLQQAEIWGLDRPGIRLLEKDNIDFTLPYSVLNITSAATSSERLSAMKTWASENPIIVYGELETPVETDLTDEQMAAYKNAFSSGGNYTLTSEAEIDARVSGVASTKSTDDLHAEIVEQTTQAILEADRMLVTALESYVKNDDYGTFRETVLMELEALADRLTLSFKQATDATDAVNADLQAKYNTIETYFTFEIDGLTIGKSNNPYKMVLTNERYSMMVNESEVMYIDAKTNMAYFPQLTVKDAFILCGYKFEIKDGVMDIDWIGGE